MKKLTLLLILVPFFSFCQVKKSETKSNIENISEQSGILLKKEFIDIGKVLGVQLQVYKLTNLSNNVTTTGVRFEYAYKSSYGSDTKIGVIDADELDGLIKSIETMQTNIFDLIPDNYTEVVFKSRSGFEAGCYSSKGIWKTYIQIEKYDSDSNVFMSKEDFASMLALLKVAKTKL